MNASASTKQIVVCVHDVSPRHWDRLERIHEFLEALGVGGRYSMLVVPDFWREWPLRDHPEFCAWLRARQSEGVEMLLHGYTHRDETEHSSARARLAARTMTAREGEFYGLTHGEALDRIADGRALLEDILGAEVDGFVAPAWLYSDGARRALRDLGFRVAEDHLSVWRPDTGETVLRGPVVSYASRDRRRIVGSLAWSRTASVALAPVRTVRHAIHPHDFDVNVLISEIRRSLAGFLQKRSPTSYRELAG
jgi:predicted deacetylase